MAKVFVTQETNLDYSTAEKFGEVVFLSIDRKDDLNNVTNSEHNQRLLAHITHGLRHFDEAEDWLIITGSPYVNAAVFWLLGLEGCKTIRLLRWDNRDFHYIPLPLKLRPETIDGNR